MSTRCQIALHDCAPTKDLPADRTGSLLLYHHADGYPSFQLVKVCKFLDEINKRLSAIGYPYWWDSERVGAMMVALSANKYEVPSYIGETEFKKVKQQHDSKLFVENRSYGYPQYQPSASLHGDIAYLYDVFLMPAAISKGKNKYEVVVHATAFDADEKVVGTEVARRQADGKVIKLEGFR